MYELSDINPSKLHISVPRRFRKHSKCPEILILHSNDIPESDIQEREGYRVTRPSRTICDLLNDGKVSFEFFEQAIRESINRGYITLEQVKKMCTDFPDIYDIVNSVEVVGGE